jgi:hypothetical protein
MRFTFLGCFAPGDVFQRARHTQGSALLVPADDFAADHHPFPRAIPAQHAKLAGKAVFVLHFGPLSEFVPKRRGMRLVLESSRSYRTPEAAIMALCRAVGKLPPEYLKIWDASQKTFDIGYDVLPGLGTTQVKLSARVVESVRDLGADLAFTYYQLELDERGNV